MVLRGLFDITSVCSGRAWLCLVVPSLSDLAVPRDPRSTRAPRG